jgi:HEAT repeat protein
VHVERRQREVNNRDVIQPLIRALKDPFWPVRKNASESLVALAHFSVSELINYVNDEDEDIQYWVLKTLKAIGSPALPEIVWLLRKGSDEQRFFAAKALGKMRDPQSVEPLIASLTDGHEWVRLYSAVALGELGDPRAVRHLIACLSDPSFKVHTAIHKVFEGFGSAAIPELREAIRGPDLTTSRNALRILGRFRPDELLEEIGGYLQHPQDDMKLAAIDALANYVDRPQVVSTLSGLLSTGSDKVRNRIFAALGDIGSQEAIAQMLRALLLVETEKEKRQLVDQILRHGDRAATALVRELGNERVPLRKTAATLLSRMGERARAAIEEALKGDDKNVRFWANKLLKALAEGQVLE